MQHRPGFKQTARWRGQLSLQKIIKVLVVSQLAAMALLLVRVFVTAAGTADILQQFELLPFELLPSTNKTVNLVMPAMTGRAVEEATGVTRVIISAYYRSGSTMTGELFSSHNDTFYFFEPTNAIRVNRYLADARLLNYSSDSDPVIDEALLRPLHNVLNCSFYDLPIEMMLNPMYGMMDYTSFNSYLRCTKKRGVRNLRDSNACYASLYKECVKHPRIITSGKVYICYNALEHLRRGGKPSAVPKAYSKFYKCMSKLYKKVQPCLTELQQTCTSAKLVVAKEVWTDLRLVRTLLRRNKGYKAIHLIRDPRGMLVSRERAAKGMINSGHVLETCTRLATDVATYQQMVAEFPHDVIQIRYEDIVQQPEVVAMQVYNRVGLNASTSKAYLDAWLTRISGSSKQRVISLFNTVRKNMSAEAYDWMKLMSKSNRKFIEDIPICAKIIRELNYPALLP